MKKINFSMLKDGERTVITLSGDEGKDEIIWKILSSYCELDSPKETALGGATIPCVTDLEPLPNDEPAVVPAENLPTYQEAKKAAGTISSGEYKGMTATAALHQDKSRALGQLFGYAAALQPGKEREDIVAACKRFMNHLPEMTDIYNTRDSIIGFVKDVSKMMHITPFLAGYRDISSFAEYASDNEVKAIFAAIAKTLQDRSRQTKPGV